MKNLYVSLVAIISLVAISATCTGPSLVSKEGLYNKDTICIATEPGYTYEVKVIPIKPNEKPDVVPQITTSSGGPVPINSSPGGSHYVFGVRQDTVHMSVSYGDDDLPTIIECPPGTMVPIPCVYEPSGTLWVPCVDGREIVCDQDTVHYVE